MVMKERRKVNIWAANNAKLDCRKEDTTYSARIDLE